MVTGRRRTLATTARGVLPDDVAHATAAVREHRATLLGLAGALVAASVAVTAGVVDAAVRRRGPARGTPGAGRS